MKRLWVDVNSGKTDASGNAGILSRKKLALIYSQRCPGALPLETYDFAWLGARHASSWANDELQSSSG